MVRVELIQVNESEFWAGNYGIRYSDFEITGVESGTIYNDKYTWNYSWTVSTTATSTTAIVSATDNAGNSYTGTESMTFLIDNSNPSLTILKPTGTYTNQSVVVTLTYDEAIIGLTTDTTQFSEATNIASFNLTKCF